MGWEIIDVQKTGQSSCVYFIIGSWNVRDMECTDVAYLSLWKIINMKNDINYEDEDQELTDRWQIDKWWVNDKW